MMELLLAGSGQWPDEAVNLELWWVGRDCYNAVKRGSQHGWFLVYGHSHTGTQGYKL